MTVGVEQGKYIEVPAATDAPRPPLEGRFHFRELSGDRIEVHHPFHEPPTILGNSTTITDTSMDAAAVVLFKELTYLADSRKLNRVQRFETRPFAGEYSQLGHCFSLGMLAVEFAGGPMDILDGLYNDASQTYNGHQGDDNYQGHGYEDLHDRERAKFFERSGIVEALIEAGALRRNESGIYVGKSRLSIERLLSEDEVTVRRSFLSNKHKARRMDADRFQYTEEERLLMNYATHMSLPSPSYVPLALAAQSLDAVVRRIILEDNEGDQLVFTDDQVAFNVSMEYVRHNSEHWTEPVQDLVNDLLNLAERYFFVCGNRQAQNYQYFYPRDYLHTSASLMIDRFDTVANDDPAMAWFLDTAERIARHQRKLHLNNRVSNTDYSGPEPPDGVELRRLDDYATLAPLYVQSGTFRICLPGGKVRTIDPRVSQNGGYTTKPLTEIHPEYSEYSNERHQWAGNYQAMVDIEDPELADQIRTALDLVKKRWSSALSRPFMPHGELRKQIQEANEYVRKIGNTATRTS